MVQNNQETTLVEAYKQLEKQSAAGAPRPELAIPYLGLKHIKRRPEVFQHRAPLSHVSDAHIGILTKALSSGKDLDPIKVWWDGTGWNCIDGHHRIEAYIRAGKGGPYQVPVEVFKGTLAEAIAEAARGNTRDKLPMDAREKLAAAWRLVTLGLYSKADIVELAGVSDGTVANMRRVRTKLLDMKRGRDLSELTWNSARLEAAGEEPSIIDWDEQLETEAQAFADALAKHFGKRIHKRREAFIRALEIYDAQLPEEMIRQWRDRLDEDDEFLEGNE